MVVHHAVRDVTATTPAAVPDGHAPALDLAAALERVMGDRDLLQRVLTRFAADYRDVAARLRAALAAHDTELAQRIAHTLKGASGMIDAGLLRQRALDLELALKAGAGDGAQVAGLVNALDAELARVLQEVDAMLAGPHAVPLTAAPVAELDLTRLRAMLDIGDGRASDLVQQWRPGLLAALGPERMRTFDTAISRFDFERALALLEQREEQQKESASGS